MTHMTHTPGPWGAWGGTNARGLPYFVVGPVLQPSISMVPSSSVAVLDFVEANGGAIGANATLIAAAPELLAALKELLPLWEEAIGYEEDYMDMANSARAAIAKAEGRTE